MKKRKYIQKRRAAQQEETRERIVEAAVQLHEQLGPAATTVKAVAECAGVQRLTVYRHFPDDERLFEACSSHWFGLNSPPAGDAWSELADPADRTRTALLAFNRYYRKTQGMFASVYRDRETVPALAPVLAAFDAILDTTANELATAWKPETRSGAPLRATLRHCLSFATWQSLAAQGLSDEKMTDLAMQWLSGVVAHTG